MTDVNANAATFSIEDIDNFFSSRENTGVAGLKLLDKACRHCAKHRDWDPLAVFMGKADIGMRGQFARIIHAFFGNRLEGSVSKKHARGYQFVIKWPVDFIPAPTNAYGYVTEAIEKGKAFDNRELQKNLVSKPDEEKPFDVNAFMTRMYKTLAKNGVNISIAKAKLTVLDKGHDIDNGPGEFVGTSADVIEPAGEVTEQKAA